MPTTTPFNNLITFSRGSNATVTGSNGLIQWAPNNLLTFSEQFDNAAWSTYFVTVAGNTTVAPDGSRTADTLTFAPSVIDYHSVFRTVIVAAGLPYTTSVYAKAGTTSVFSMEFRGSSSAPDVVFNLANGTVTSGTGTITPVGDGWYRCSITKTSVDTSELVIFGTGLISAAGTIFLWGAQLELGSTATTYNSTTVKNLFGFSEAFDNAGWTKTRASIVTGAQANPVNGLFNAQKLMEDTTASNTHFIRQSVPNVPAGPVVFSTYVKAAGRSFIRLVDASYGNGAYFNLANGTVGGLDFATATITDVGNGWYRCAVYYVSAAAGSHGLDIRLANAATGGSDTYTGDGNSGVYIYGAQLSDSASLDPYVPTPGAAPSSTAFYGPRFDFDPVTRLPRGLLVEEQRTNIVTYSEQFDNAAWTKLNATVTANATASPDGTVNADKLAEDATAGVGHLISQGPTLTAVAHTYSVYAKASERNWICLLNNSIINGFAFFNLATGAIGTVGSGATATITNTGNGWYRCSITFTAIAATNNCHIRLAPSDNVLSYNGVAGNGAFIYGAQLEAGTFATSYIPTVASTVTRSADVATISGQNFAQWYRQDEGTILIGFQTIETGVVAFTGYALGFDNSASKRLVYIGAGADVAASFDGTTVLSSGVDATGMLAKVVSAYSGAGRAISANGNAVATATAVAGYSTASLLNIGHQGGGNVLNSRIQSIRFIPARAADFQLQALTEPALVPTLDLDFLNNLYEA